MTIATAPCGFRPGARAALVTLILLLAAGALGRGAAPDAAPRAVWIWEQDTFRMLDDDGFLTAALAFLEQRRVSTLYLYADEFRGRDILLNEPQKYHTLIAAAHRRGFAVYALLGSAYLRTPEYILPEKRAAAVRMFGKILQFNSAGEALSRFDGVNIDIEPYLLGDWNAQRQLRVRQYLDVSAEFMRMKAAAGSTIPVGPAMPFWFDGIDDVEWQGKRQRLNEHVQDIYDYVAVMDYRNVAEGSDGIVAHALNELAYADRAGRKVTIGLETGPSTPAKVTFSGKDALYMEDQMRQAEAAFSRHPSFAGFVIHHLGSYRTLVAGGSR